MSSAWLLEDGSRWALEDGSGVWLLEEDDPFPGVVLAPPTLPNGVVGRGYLAQMSATGGNGEYAFFVTAGELPDGLTLSTDGVLSGVPTTPGPRAFTIFVRDSQELWQSDQIAYTVTIALAGGGGGSGGGSSGGGKRRPLKPEGDFAVPMPGAAEFFAASDASEPAPVVIDPPSTWSVPAVPMWDAEPTQVAILRANLALARAAEAEAIQTARMRAQERADVEQRMKILAVVNFVDSLNGA